MLNLSRFYSVRFRGVVFVAFVFALLWWRGQGAAPHSVFKISCYFFPSSFLVTQRLVLPLALYKHLPIVKFQNPRPSQPFTFQMSVPLEALALLPSRAVTLSVIALMACASQKVMISYCHTSSTTAV